MIRIVNQTPPTPPPPPDDDDDVDVGDLRIAIHKGKRKWDLVLVITRARLREIMQPRTLLSCLVDEVPGFGQVPPVLFAFLSAQTRQGMTVEQLGLEAALSGASANMDFVGVLPVVLSREHSAMLRKTRMTALAAQGGESLTKHKVPAWERLDAVILLLADTQVEVNMELEKFRKKPGNSVEVATDDESMW